MPATKIKTRTKPRVEDTENNRGAVGKKVAHREAQVAQVPIGPNGRPMIEIFIQKSELVPVAQYASVTIGPIGVRRWVEDDGSLEGLSLEDAITATSGMVDNIIAEDRALVEESVRMHNEREEEAEKKKSRR
jgi:hypothetical protein